MIVRDMRLLCCSIPVRKRRVWKLFPDPLPRRQGLYRLFQPKERSLRFADEEDTLGRDASAHFVTDELNGAVGLCVCRRPSHRRAIRALVPLTARPRVHADLLIVTQRPRLSDRVYHLH